MNHIKQSVTINFSLTEPVKVIVPEIYSKKLYSVMNHLKYQFLDIEFKKDRYQKYMYFSTVGVFGVFNHKELFEICIFKELNIEQFLSLVTIKKVSNK